MQPPNPNSQLFSGYAPAYMGHNSFIVVCEYSTWMWFQVMAYELTGSAFYLIPLISVHCVFYSDGLHSELKMAGDATHKRRPHSFFSVPDGCSTWLSHSTQGFTAIEEGIYHFRIYHDVM